MRATQLSLTTHVRTDYLSSFADNHKPASIDPAKSGTLEVNPGREVTAVRVERPTANVRTNPLHHPTPMHKFVLTRVYFAEQRSGPVQRRGEARKGVGLCAYLRRGDADVHAREARLARQP